MKICIAITKEDIVTQKNGLHYEIHLPQGLIINFTPEAAQEFINDVKSIEVEATPVPVRTPINVTTSDNACVFKSNQPRGNSNNFNDNMGTPSKDDMK